MAEEIEWMRLTAEELRARVVDALARLPDRQREVVVLRIIDGERWGAIAETLDLSEGTAKTHLRRALERLRALLAPLAEVKP